MTTLVRRRANPVTEMLRWLESEEPFGFRGLGLAPFVRVEDYVEEGKYVLRAEMPGIDPDKDVEITVDGDILTISGERKEERKDKGLREFHYGTFSRSVTLPHRARTDEIAASYGDGVLEVVVPFDGEPATAHHVTVRRADDKGTD